MFNVLTAEDIEFLRNLANELLTQDTLATRTPVYFSIYEKDIQVGFDEDYSDAECFIFDSHNHKLCKSLEEAKEFFKENYPGYSAECISDIDSMAEFKDYCDVHTNISVTHTGYKDIETHKGVFLTRKALKEHVEANKHHYRSPGNYCHHAWRNPELERLLAIVQKFADVDKQNKPTTV